MKRTTLPLLLASLILSAPVSAQVIYNNGVAKGGDGAFGLTTNPGQGFGGSDASQVNPNYGYGLSASQYADDFTLNVSSNVTSLTVYSYVTNSSSTLSPITGTTINLWSGQPGSGGSIIATSSNQTSSVFSNVYRTRADVGNTSFARPIYATTVSFTGLTLGAGSYWFSFSQTGTGTINSPFVTALVNGTPQAIAGNSLVNDGTSWIPTPYQPLANTNLPTIRPELAFLINGTVNAPEPGSVALLIPPMATAFAFRSLRRRRRLDNAA